VTGRFVIERLTSSHDRNDFSSGSDPLDRYLRQSAAQDTRKRVANCFVAIERATGRVAAFYTLSAAGVRLSDLPDVVTRRLPHYPAVPAALIGRLAVDTRFCGQRLGEALLLDAADRVLDSDPAVFALIVDAKDENAVSFYKRYEFRPLQSRPMTLFLPVTALEARRRKDVHP
jgi:ribosomal protein S18 acetylase RimI-like enzyme